MYQYRRLDNDEVIEVDFDTMINQSAGGFIELEIGGVKVEAKRVHDQTVKVKKVTYATDPPIVSDSLGFGQHQLADFERDRVAHGFTGVEFVRDPQVPEFFQARIGSVKELEAYRTHRGLTDRNSRNGSTATVSPKQMAEAEKWAKGKWGEPKK